MNLCKFLSLVKISNFCYSEGMKSEKGKTFGFLSNSSVPPDKREITLQLFFDENAEWTLVKFHQA